MEIVNIKKIKGILAMNDLSYKDIAKELGISPLSFSRKINGVVEFKISELKKLADYFKTDINIFFN